MKLHKVLFIASLVLFTVSSVVSASDFEWARDLNIQAQADPSGFRARLATRFKIGDVQVNAVLSNVDDPADAYIILRLGEMSGRPLEQVVEKYKSGKGKGWGALAKSLGIKPGSREFQALKQGHDLNASYKHGKVTYTDENHDSDKNNGNDRGKGKKWTH